ncbi:uncharacterized protein (DUF58 family) [Cytobacillus purgationiresistens]|uniref:Uncharacterized protein (DUF58 family) n=1 Tax=Cytobacillus purgationiresistens TaxID=863449 RepID=A0ABU0AKW0_9BACI|nr:uncharacterized protein (DUF58 family) [Cytobacillus purgationiresistens]
MSTIIATILLLASFYFKLTVVFFTAVFILLLIYANMLYLKRVGDKLILINEKTRTKLFTNDRGEWLLTFENRGLPVMNGELRIFYNDVVSPEDKRIEERQANYEMNIPFSINYKQRKEIRLPFIANKRGLAKIRKIELHIPHFFGLGEAILQYKYLTKQEVLVYPVTIPVMNKKIMNSNRPGDSQASQSLFEDHLSPAGTRNYVYSDSFNRIHWKASARNQQLQTKIYDHTAEKGWNISLNISVSHSVSKQMEELISSAAELAYFFQKNDISYSICVNLRVNSSTPFLYIPFGKGKEHLQKVLEMLAVADRHGSIYPYDKMLSFYARHLPRQPYFLHGGQKQPKAQNLLDKIQKNGASLFQLHTNNQTATIGQLSLTVKDVHA